VFTARYGLIPYITQIHFVFKGLSNWCSFHTSLNDLVGRGVNNYSTRPEHKLSLLFKGM